MIRVGLPEDAIKVARFMKQFEQASSFIKVDVEHTGKMYEDLVKSGGATLLILEEDGKMQGGLGFIIYPDLHCGTMTAVETYWFVAPEFRGLGMQLFDAFEAEAKKLGAQKLAMVHMEDSYPNSLKKLYLSKEYKLVEQHYVKEVLP